MIQENVFRETNIFSTVDIGTNPLLSMDLEAKKTKEGIAVWEYTDVPHKL